MTHGRYRFEGYLLDPADRRLTRDGATLELNGRYFDALALLVREHGRLVTKDRFMEEIWRGTPVTDEALTQCVRSLRRLLGDDAARPRFIETAPRHGYRFIAPVERVEGPPSAPATTLPAGRLASPRGPVVVLGLAGMAGGGLAGVVGGLIYGFAAAAGPAQAGMGAVSILLVLACLTAAVGLVGGAGVGLGVAAAGLAAGRAGGWSMAGGAAGGMVVGALVKLLGLDAFNLLFGHAPGDITGAPEGLLLGAAVGLGVWLAGRGARPLPLRLSAAAAGLAGGVAGGLIALSGGRLMGGSLDLLARRFPESRLRLDSIGTLFGESGFGPITHVVTAVLEGALFGACVVGMMILARRRLAAGA